MAATSHQQEASATPTANAAPEGAPARLRADVEALAAIERRATTRGEMRSAQWVAERLREVGASDVSLVPYRGHSTWAWPYAAHFAAGLLASAVGGARGAALALTAMFSLEADYTGRSQWLRRRLPAGTGTSVAARLPAAGRAQRTVVIVAHHDAAHTGLAWHPRVQALSRRQARRTGRTPSYQAINLLALGLIATGVRGLRAAGAAALATSIALALEGARSETVPGANDNATGVAGMLELARRLVADPLPEVEVILLAPGGEEVGTAGMSEWMRTAGRRLDPRRTLVVGFDSIGSGEAAVSVKEASTGRYRAADVELVDAGADRLGIPRPKRFGLGAPTDVIVARYAGLRAVSIVSQRDGGIANLHLPTDVPDNVDWPCVERCVSLAQAAIAAWRAG